MRHGALCCADDSLSEALRLAGWFKDDSPDCLLTQLCPEFRVYADCMFTLAITLEPPSSSMLDVVGKSFTAKHAAVSWSYLGCNETSTVAFLQARVLGKPIHTWGATPDLSIAHPSLYLLGPQGSRAFTGAASAASAVGTGAGASAGAGAGAAGDGRAGDSSASASPRASSQTGQASHVTEDEVMVCQSLDTFSNTLPAEDAERLVSFLTTPYANPHSNMRCLL